MIKMYFTTVIQYCATSETDMIYRNIKWIKNRNPFYLISYRIFISFTVFFCHQKHLEQTLKDFHQRIWQREKDLQELREALKTYKVSLTSGRKVSCFQTLLQSVRISVHFSLTVSCVLTALCTDSSG